MSDDIRNDKRLTVWVDYMANDKRFPYPLNASRGLRFRLRLWNWLAIGNFGKLIDEITELF